MCDFNQLLIIEKVAWIAWIVQVVVLFIIIHTIQSIYTKTRLFRAGAREPEDVLWLTLSKREYTC